MVRKAKAVPVKEVSDSRAITAGSKSMGKQRILPEYCVKEYSTIFIPEQDGEQDWVDVFVSGTRKDKETGQEMPFTRRLWIQRGVDVVNVPNWAVHILMDTAVETRYRQQEGATKKGGSKVHTLAYKKKSIPCSVKESYDEAKEVDETMSARLTDQMPGEFDEE